MKNRQPTRASAERASVPDAPLPQAPPSESGPLRASTSSNLSALLAFRRLRAQGESITARQFVEREQIVDPEITLDLAFAEYLDEETVDAEHVFHRLQNEFPHLARDLQRQVTFHRALHAPPGAGEDSQHLVSTKTGAAQTCEISHESPVPFEHSGLQLLKLLGRGGMGVVYLAHQPALDRNVAVKLLLGGAYSSAAQRARFRAEARLAASLRHPNIVQVDEVGDSAGQPYLVMEYVDGGTLDSHLKTERPAPSEAAQFIRTLALALHEAHSLGILHRDLKPGNILLSRGSQSVPKGASQSKPGHSLNRLTPKIADFGLAKLQQDGQSLSGPTLTLAGDILGTPSYMAPEQAQGHRTGPWTDVYSLGAILYELLAGQPPYLASSPWDTLRKLMEDDPPPLPRTVPRDIRTICHKCLLRRPQDRYTSMLGLAEDLQRFLDGRPIEARRVSPVERAFAWCQRNQRVTLLVTIILLTLSTLLGVSWRSRSQLQSLLNQMAVARESETAAHTTALVHLWDSLLSEALAQQLTGRVGQRTRSLEQITAARDLLPSIGSTTDRSAALRDAAAASLALSDLHFLAEWNGPKLPTPIATDGNLQRVANLVDGSVMITEDQGTQLRFTLPVPDASGLAMSNSGRWLAVFGSECQVFDLKGTEPLQVTHFPSAGYWGFSPDENYLVGCADDALIVFNLAQNQVDHRLPRIHSEYPLAFSNDNRQVAILQGDTIRILDYLQGKFEGQLPAGEAVPGNHCLAWHPDQKHLAAAIYEKDLIVLWDTTTGRRSRSYRQDGLSHSLAFDSTGQHLLCCSDWEGYFKVFDVESETLQLSLRSSTLSRLVTTNQGVRALLKTDSRKNGIWEFRPQTVLWSLPTESENITTRHTVDISPDGQWVLVATGDGLEIFHTRTKRLAAELPVGLVFNGKARFDQQGRVWACQPNGWLRWTFQGDQLGAPEFLPSQDDFWPIEIDHQGNYALTSNSWDVRLESLIEPGKVILLGPHPDVRGCAFSPDGSLVVTGAWNGNDAKVWKVADGTLLTTLKTGPLNYPKFSPDGRWLITSSDGGVVWSTSTWQSVLELNCPGSIATGMAITCSPDSQRLVVSRLNGELQFWDLAHQVPLGILRNPSQDRIEGLAFSPDQSELYSTRNDKRGVISAWNLSRFQTELEALKIDFPYTSHRGQPTGLPTDPPVERLLVQENDVSRRFLAKKLSEDATRALDREDWQRALDLLRQAVQLNPQDARSQNTLAWNLVVAPPEFRNPQEALAAATQAVNLDHQAIYLNTLGGAQYRCGDLDNAIESLTKSLGDRSSDSAVFDYLLLACCHSKLGNQEQARESLAAAHSAEARIRDLISGNWARHLRTLKREAESLVQSQAD